MSDLLMRVFSPKQTLISDVFFVFFFLGGGEKKLKLWKFDVVNGCQNKLATSTNEKNNFQQDFKLYQQKQL